MRVEDLVFEVRDSSLARVGQLTPADGLTSFKATLRLNNVGSWQIDIPEGRPLADVLRAPGSGIIVTNTLTNTVILSGPTVAATKTSDSGESVALWSIRGTDDSVILGERLAYPTPTSADVTAQTSAYDAVSAVKASTAMIGYVRRNLVAGVAPAARAITGLTTVTDPVAGSTISYAARFDMLGQVLTDIANVDGLAFDIYQSGSALMFNVWAPVDRSKTIRLDVANNTLQKATYGYGYGMSRAIVGGQGEGAARTFTEVSTSTSLQTESSFGRRVEKFIDQRQESDSAKLVTAGQATLADAGGLITSVDVVPTSDTTMRPLVDFTLGDKVSVVVASQEVAAVITQMSVSVTDMGVYVGITVGNPVGVDFEAITAKRQTDTSARVSSLEVLDKASGGGSSTISATAPTNPIAGMTWINSNDGSAFFWYNGAWVEIKNPSDFTPTSATASLTTRVGAVETTTTTQGTRINTIGTGYFIRQIVTQVDTVGRTSGTSWTLGPTFATLNYAANSLIKMSYHIPTRNTGSGWGGGYIEPQVSFNGGAWQSLGSSGHDAAVMILNNEAILTYHGEVLLNPGITSAFTAAFRFYFRSYDGTLGWNNGINHDINNVSGTAAIMSGDNGNQHYMHAIIEEYGKA